MMLSAFRPKPEYRYAAAGCIAGALVPVVCLFCGLMVPSTIDLGLVGFAGAATVAVLLMPFLCAAMFYHIGRFRSRMMRELRLRYDTETQLLREVHQDRLTGLSNRFALERHVEDLLGSPDRKSRCDAFLLLDLDRFKYVNDTMGHDAGDALLVTLSRRLTRILAGTASTFRLGGDEFVIAISGSPSQGKVEAICDAVTSVLDEPFTLAASQFWTGGSLGITFLQADDTSMSPILKRADLALYKAKEIPGNSHVYFDQAMMDEASVRMEIENDLARALACGEFYLEYQPIVGIESRAIRSFEALIRWRHPVRGVIQPDLFIGIAEATGLILPLGNWVVRTACLEAARWPMPTGVAVNVAGDQFRDRSFVNHVRSCLDEAGLAPGRLTIEVTESIFTVDPQIVCDSLAELRSFGVRIALDDFGVGFSSINNLRRFPLDQLKIDRSFTQGMLGSKRDAELVDIILKLGNTFQVSTTIEGIETEGQMDFVRALGASEAQGFLISRPLPADEVIALLDRDTQRLSLLAG